MRPYSPDGRNQFKLLTKIRRRARFIHTAVLSLSHVIVVLIMWSMLLSTTTTTSRMTVSALSPGGFRPRTLSQSRCRLLTRIAASAGGGDNDDPQEAPRSSSSSNNRRIGDFFQNKKTPSSFLLGAMARAERTLTTRTDYADTGGNIAAETDDKNEENKSRNKEEETDPDDSERRSNTPLIQDLSSILGELKSNIPQQGEEQGEQQQIPQSTRIENGMPAGNHNAEQEKSGTGDPTTTLNQQRNQTTTMTFRPTGPDDIFLHYGFNPTITSTALAHHLWRHVLRPGLDSAIDATAGNGGDTKRLAQILFGDDKNNTMDWNVDNTQSRLVAVDIQKDACERTRQELESVMTQQELASSSLIKIVHGSHAPLPLPDDYYLDNNNNNNNNISIALVVYNLGYLPNSSKEYLTQTPSTLQSLQGAVRVLRLGGLLSVMTYPRSNHREDWAVRIFLEGLALFSSNTQDWRDFVDDVDMPMAVVREEEEQQQSQSDKDDSCQSGDETISARQLVRNALQELWDERRLLPKKQRMTWRVHAHRKLGWTDAPILLTAVRIK